MRCCGVAIRPNAPHCTMAANGLMDGRGRVWGFNLFLIFLGWKSIKCFVMDSKIILIYIKCR